MEIATNTERWKFGRHDRIVIDGQAYRAISKEKRRHILQLVVDDIVQEDHFVTKTDAEITDLLRRNMLRHDPGYFSRALSLIRVRRDSSDLSDLREDEIRTVLWKVEWCTRFAAARADMTAAWRPTMSLSDIAIFIEEYKSDLDRWYLDRFRERRPAGRHVPGKPRKPYDYPSPSSLRNWVLHWHANEERMEAFRPKYHLCGNRNQLDPRAKSVVAECVEGFASSRRPLMRDIYEAVESKLHKMNLALPAGSKRIYVSRNAVNRRIRKIDPFLRDYNRLGPDRTHRKYEAIGTGLTSTNPLQRVEMDDWEIDLFALVEKSSVWKNLSKADRDKVPRIRCNITIAIDVATRCIVGFNLSPNPPSTASSKTALRRVFRDKTALATMAGARNDWATYGQPSNVVTDGGAAFLGDFEDAIYRSGLSRLLPEKNPRQRGTIEAFFRIFKRLCRYFAGQSFANVVERGDYPSERLASLTVAELEKNVIRFIVDSYHCRPHRGLFGCTPYETWKRLTKDGRSPPVSETRQRVAFGMRVPRKLGKHGVVHLDISYNSEALNKLYRRHENAEVDVFVDPLDLGSVLVRIPGDRYEAQEQALDDYLVVPCVDDRANGLTLDSYLINRKHLAVMAKDDEAAGLIARLEAHDALMDAGERTRREAGLREFRATSTEYERVIRAVQHKNVAALDGPDQGPPQPIDEIPGRVVARSARRKTTQASAGEQPDVLGSKSTDKQQRPFGGSLNLGDDE